MLLDLQSDVGSRSNSGIVAGDLLHHAVNFKAQNLSATGSPFGLVAAAACVTLAAVLASGCGASYRPVVSAINPVGPAGQPTKFAVAVSSPSPTAPGLVTVVDFSGDTILATPNILPNPSYFVLGSGGSIGYAINANGALDSFAVSNPTALMTSNVSETTLIAGAGPSTITPFSGNGGSQLYIPQVNRSSIAALSASGPSLLQELTVTVNPTYVVAADGSPRIYALSRGTGAGAGQATAFETTSLTPTISNTIPVGNNPVYGVISADLTRAYIVNKGSGTVSVVNVQTNAPDVTTPTIPASGTLGLNPVWAELVPTLSELLVVNAGDGVNPGSISIVSIPLCNSVSQPTNPNCNAANPTDAVGFGTVVATVPVGINPVMTSALRDGSRVYVANTRDTARCGGEGSVSVISLMTNTVTATICGTSTTAGTLLENSSPTLIYGHPNSISATLAVPTGKVYVTSGDNKFMTVIRTDTDTVSAHISLQGLGVRVLVTQP